MDKCQITFKNDVQSIIIDFNIDDNDNADYTIKMDPEVKDKNATIGLPGYLCQIFLDALHSNGSSDEEQPDNN